MDLTTMKPSPGNALKIGSPPRLGQGHSACRRRWAVETLTFNEPATVLNLASMQPAVIIHPEFSAVGMRTR